MEFFAHLEEFYQMGKKSEGVKKEGKLNVCWFNIGCLIRLAKTIRQDQVKRPVLYLNVFDSAF